MTRPQAHERPSADGHVSVPHVVHLENDLSLCVWSLISTWLCSEVSTGEFDLER